MLTYPTVGIALALADVSNVTYVVLPPRASEGFHNPPHPMLFILLSGLAHVTVPDSSKDEIWVMEGLNGLLVATDLTGRGHVTEYPSDKETVALQLPFRDGKIAEHEVLYRGACQASSQVQPNCQETGPAYADSNAGPEQYALRHLI
ncbi:putative Cupin type-1 domain-containing protein [Seiridium cardinale]